MRCWRGTAAVAGALLAVGMAVGIAWADGGARVVGGPGEWHRRLPPWQVDLPNPNGWDLYAEAGRLFQPESEGVASSDTFDGASFAGAVFRGDGTLVPAWRPRMAECVGVNQTALNLIHQARDMDCMAPPRTDLFLCSTELEDLYAHVRGLARIETGRAALLHLEGRDAEALDAVEDAPALGDHVARGADLLCGSAAMGIVGIASRAGIGLLTHAPNLGRQRLFQHAEFVQTLRRGAWPLWKTMHVEGDHALRGLQALPDEVYREVVADAEEGDPLALRRAERHRERARHLLPPIVEWADRYYAGLLPLLDRPTWAMDVRSYDERVGELPEWTPDSWDGYDEAREIASGWSTSKTIEHVTWCHAYLLAEELAPRLAAYQLDHGEYPETLGALIPAYAESIPPDPWTGKAPLYRREGPTDYVLYCTGPDRKDDGGLGNPRGVNAPDRVLIRTNWQPPSPSGAPAVVPGAK